MGNGKGGAKSFKQNTSFRMVGAFEHNFFPRSGGGGGNLNKPIFKSSVARGILKPLIFTSLLIHGKYFLMKTLFFQQSLDSFHHSPHATNGGDY